MSDVEKGTMRGAVSYLQEVADSARIAQAADNFFLLADWKWVSRNTRVRNPLEATFRFQSPRVSINYSKRKLRETMRSLELLRNTF